jgi:uroporphyrin-III C-methyltransferase/precorrin-2 dehydrogenase/sirohydrochlorin ferrochelatase
LATIERQAVRACLGGPTLCLVGEVVGLALARDPEFRFVSGIGL